MGREKERGRGNGKRLEGEGGLTAVKGENDLGLGIVLFILFFKPVRFGPVQSV